MFIVGNFRGKLTPDFKLISESRMLVEELNKNVKYKLFELYIGKRNKLKGFIIQLEFYMAFHAKIFNSDIEKVLWIIILFIGKALQWIKGYFLNYLKYKEKLGEIISDMEPYINEIFRS